MRREEIVGRGETVGRVFPCVTLEGLGKWSSHPWTWLLRPWCSKGHISLSYGWFEAQPAAASHSKCSAGPPEFLCLYYCCAAAGGLWHDGLETLGPPEGVPPPQSLPAVLCIAWVYKENSREKTNSRLSLSGESAAVACPEHWSLQGVVGQTSCRELICPVPGTNKTLNLWIRVIPGMVHLWRKHWAWCSSRVADQ